MIGSGLSGLSNRGLPSPGLVSLVGAGPGDADLLTRRAVDRLARADVVFHDALLDPAVLELAAPGARLVCVGKRAGRPGTAQAVIHELLVRAARQGERVVRLKCGDPFVLGRGGEEALALRAAGVPFEIVPGLTSSVAGPAAAGIPVTHRGLASGFVVVSGHTHDARAPILESLAPHTATVVVLMGVGARAEVARMLLARGWRRATPVALVLGAHQPDETVVRTTLRQLARGDASIDAVVAGTRAPGLLVVGDVVTIADDLAPALAPVAASGAPWPAAVAS